MALTLRWFGKIEGGGEMRLADLDNDYETIASWYRGYGETPPARGHFSKTNFMIDGLALVGILSTDSEYTFLEPLIGNPKADPVKRKEAVDTLIEKALIQCKEMGKKYVYVSTNNPVVSGRKDRFGFQEVNQVSVFRRNL